MSIYPKIAGVKAPSLDLRVLFWDAVREVLGAIVALHLWMLSWVGAVLMQPELARKRKKLQHKQISWLQNLGHKAKLVLVVELVLMVKLMVWRRVCKLSRNSMEKNKPSHCTLFVADKDRKQQKVKISQCLTWFRKMICDNGTLRTRFP